MGLDGRARINAHGERCAQGGWMGGHRKLRRVKLLQCRVPLFLQGREGSRVVRLHGSGVALRLLALHAEQGRIGLVISDLAGVSLEQLLIRELELVVLVGGLDVLHLAPHEIAMVVGDSRLELRIILLEFGNCGRGLLQLLRQLGSIELGSAQLIRRVLLEAPLCQLEIARRLLGFPLGLVALVLQLFDGRVQPRPLLRDPLRGSPAGAVLGLAQASPQAGDRGPVHLLCRDGVCPLRACFA